MKKLIVGNWKMNGSAAAAQSLVEGIGKGMDKAGKADLVICPPFPYIAAAAAKLKEFPGLGLGAQDCSERDDGAFTGDVSAAMLRDLGCAYVILGHSERRQHHRETDELVARKAAKAQEHGLIPIICVGETENERAEGLEREIVARQLEKSLPPGASSGSAVIAYEPVWAIGTGKTATPDDVKAMHGFIRERVGGMRILYGGSMKPGNAAALLATPNVDGGLIGGASLRAEEFLEIGGQSGI